MKRIIIVISIIVLIVAVGLVVIKIYKTETPEKEIHLARRLLSEAELVKAPKYAKAEYSKALSYYNSAMKAWKIENERYIPFRNYQVVIDLAEKSASISKDAIFTAKKNISKVEDILEVRISVLGEKIKEFEKNFGSYPINSRHQNEIIKCKLQYSEGVQAFKNKNYSSCETKLDSVENTIKEVFVIYQEKFKAYLNKYPEWKEATEQTIKYSKKHKTYCIVVDKLHRKCLLYKDGKLIYDFPVELGINWVGTKNQQGDKSTPEGFYKIIDKKSNGHSKYYKALLLDYPNEDDKIRFLHNKKNGVINRNADIGGLIEIHGHGGKGIDWTQGCVALKDSDIDVIYKLCPVNTKVTIVGSTKAIDYPNK